jgi:catechol-2,3-dioxygenase
VPTDRGVARGRPIVFLSRDPREHHQIVLVEGRSGDLDDRVINQISLRVEEIEDLRTLLSAIEAEPDVSDINPVNHGNAWSIYFRDPDKNRLEVFCDSPWYCDQPMIQPLDLSKDDDTILSETETAIRDLPGFQPVEEWRADFAKKLQSPQH